MDTIIEINYGIFLKNILTETYKFIEQIPEQDISSKVDTIAKTIGFGWENQENDKLNLLVDLLNIKYLSMQIINLIKWKF